MNWAQEELRTIDLKDKRLNNRVKSVLESFSKEPLESIPSTVKNHKDAMATYRLFQNDKVTEAKLLDVHKESTISRIKEHKTVLLLQDTTELDYSSKSTKIKGLNRLNSDTRRGLLLHSQIAVTPDRLCLGSVGAEFINRSEEKISPSERSKLPSTEKESYRWIKGHKIANDLSKELPGTQFISVSDRESDFYDFYSEAAKGEADWIVRGYRNRQVEDNSAYDKMLDSLKKDGPLAEIKLIKPKTKSQSKREAILALYAKELTLLPPENKENYDKEKVNAIWLKEENPPENMEPISWLLLTSLPISSIDSCFDIVNYYLCRWEIELFFKTLKSGCKVEELQLEKVERLKPCLILYMIVAWRILYLTMLGRRCPDLPCNIVFEKIEWETAYQVHFKATPPKDPPTLQDMIIIIASFGGFLNRKNDMPPGNKTMWIGLQKLACYCTAAEAFSEISCRKKE